MTGLNTLLGHLTLTSIIIALFLLLLLLIALLYVDQNTTGEVTFGQTFNMASDKDWQILVSHLAYLSLSKVGRWALTNMHA